MAVKQPLYQGLGRGTMAPTFGNSRYRVVLDSCILVNVCQDNYCGDRGLFNRLGCQRELCTSDYILKEVRCALYKNPLQPKKVWDHALSRLCGMIPNYVIHTPLPEDSCEDPDDVPILGTALAAGAMAIFTRDGVLCRMGEFRGIKIYHPRDEGEFNAHLASRDRALRGYSHPHRRDREIMYF